MYTLFSDFIIEALRPVTYSRAACNRKGRLIQSKKSYLYKISKLRHYLFQNNIK